MILAVAQAITGKWSTHYKWVCPGGKGWRRHRARNVSPDEATCGGKIPNSSSPCEIARPVDSRPDPSSDDVQTLDEVRKALPPLSDAGRNDYCDDRSGKVKLSKLS